MEIQAHIVLLSICSFDLYTFGLWFREGEGRLALTRSLSTIRIPKGVSQAYGVKSVLCILIAILKGMVPGIICCVRSQRWLYCYYSFFLVIRSRSRQSFSAPDHSSSHASTTVYGIYITAYSRAITVSV